MKPSYWNRLASSLPFVRLRGNTTANVRYRDTFAPRPRVSLRDAGNSDKFDHPLNMLSKRLLILPAFVAIILMVMVCSWHQLVIAWGTIVASQKQFLSRRSTATLKQDNSQKEEPNMGIERVMVVDDDASARICCKEMLVENGYDVVESANGIGAISIYRDFQPDMVFMEITTPDMDSLLALQEIVMMDPRAKVAIVMVQGQQASLKKAMKIGAVDFVIKPFDQDQVLDTIYRTRS